jgi:hypothetical protein
VRGAGKLEFMDQQQKPLRPFMRFLARAVRSMRTAGLPRDPTQKGKGGGPKVPDSRLGSLCPGSRPSGPQIQGRQLARARSTSYGRGWPAVATSFRIFRCNEVVGCRIIGMREARLPRPSRAVNARRD